MLELTQKRLYWTGNAAKAKVIREILDDPRVQAGEDILIFDYGCGTGGDWKTILPQFRNLSVIGYDPSEKSVAIAKEKLKGEKAEFLTDSELNGRAFKADFIVSFSVLEHVYERRHYLQTAKDHLAENGVFYLNYDDGHFRTALDLNAPRTWLTELRVWLHNLLAGILARVGWVAQYQQRVNRSDIDALIAQVGFETTRVFYSNLGSLKGLYKLVSPPKREEFTRIWIAVEDALNEQFLEYGGTRLGDPANLWQFMGTRTLVLRNQ